MRLAILVLLSGCSWLVQAKANKLGRQVAAYERLAPDAESLGRGDPAITLRHVGEMAQWSFHIDQQDLPRVEKQRLVDRLTAAKRRYLLAAAGIANTPDLGYALARQALEKNDEEALAIVRTLNDARAERRQKLFASAHTYAIEDGSDGMGNCVFAMQPFGDGANPALTFRLRGRTAFYVRCYLERDASTLPRSDGTWVIGASAGGFAVKILPVRDARSRDFLVTPTLDPGDRYAALQIDLSYEYSDGLVLVWDKDRRTNLLEKRMRTIKLATSPVFWERAEDQR